MYINTHACMQREPLYSAKSNRDEVVSTALRMIHADLGVETAPSIATAPTVAKHHHSAPKSGYDSEPKRIWRTYNSQAQAECYFALGEFRHPCIVITESPQMKEFESLIDHGIPSRNIVIINNNKSEFDDIRRWLNENGYQGQLAFKMEIADAAEFVIERLRMDLSGISIDTTHNNSEPLQSAVLKTYRAVQALPYPVYIGITCSTAHSRTTRATALEYHVNNKQLRRIASVVEHLETCITGGREISFEAMGRYRNVSENGEASKDMEWCNIITGPAGTITQSKSIDKMDDGPIFQAPFDCYAEGKKVKMAAVRKPKVSKKKIVRNLTGSRRSEIEKAGVERADALLMHYLAGTLNSRTTKLLQKAGAECAEGADAGVEAKIEEIVTVWMAQRHFDLHHSRERMLTFIRQKGYEPKDSSGDPAGYLAPLTRNINLLEKINPGELNPVWPPFVLK